MRIISGIAGGRRLNTLSGHQTRPTADRVKEAMFSVLAPFLEDSRVLDAFAGSGALGLESLSRGAASALFFEKDRAAADVVAGNLALCGFENGTLIRGDVLKLLPKVKQQQPDLCFDLVFADPPYAAGLLPSLMKIIAEQGLLAPDGIFIAETAKTGEFQPDAAWRVVKESTYGDTAVHYCRLTGRD